MDSKLLRSVSCALLLLSPAHQAPPRYLFVWAGDANKQATIVARWINRKGEVGPVSNPITGTIAA